MTTSFDYNIMEEKFNKLPEEIQHALTSTDLTDAIKKIADRHDLLLDQEEIMYEMTAYVLLGLMPSKDFVENFSKESGVKHEVAETIAMDLNKEVFGRIREILQTPGDESVQAERSSSSVLNSNPTTSNTFSAISGLKTPSSLNSATLQNPAHTIAPLEHAGDFKIDSDLSLHSNPLVKGRFPAFTKTDAVGPNDHADILRHIEDPQPVSINKMELPHYEPLADHLLKNSVSVPMEKVEIKSENAIPIITTAKSAWNASSSTAKDSDAINYNSDSAVPANLPIDEDYDLAKPATLNTPISPAIESTHSIYSSKPATPVINASPAISSTTIPKPSLSPNNTTPTIQAVPKPPVTPANKPVNSAGVDSYREPVS